MYQGYKKVCNNKIILCLVFDVIFRTIQDPLSPKAANDITEKHQSSNIHLRDSQVSANNAHMGVGDIIVVQLQNSMSLVIKCI